MNSKKETKKSAAKNKKISFSDKIHLTKLQKIFIAGTASALILITALILILYFATRKPVLAFYNVPEKTRESITKILNEEQGKAKRKYYEIHLLDDKIPLSHQSKEVKKAEILIANADFDSIEYINKSKSLEQIPQEYFAGMPEATIENLGLRSHNINYVPLLYDFYQIDVNYEAFKNSGVENIALWSDFLSYVTNAKQEELIGILIPGKESEPTVNAFGMLVEALFGYEELQNIEETLYKAFKKDLDKNPGNNTYLEKALEELSSGDTAFNKTLLTIIKLIHSEILPGDFQNFTYKDFKFLMNQNRISSAILKLSEHREFKRSLLKNYRSIYSPGMTVSQKRKFLAPQIIAATSSKKRLPLLQILCETRQQELSFESGLSPVQRSTPTMDVQASDVRYWLAASLGPILPLSACVPSENALNYLARYIRENSFYR